MFEFDELDWSGSSLDGKEFGARGNARISVKGRGPFVVHCKTGAKPERLIRLRAQAHGTYGDRELNTIGAVFSEDQIPNDDTVGKNFSNLFLSESGEDEWPPRDHYTGQPKPRSEEYSLAAHTSYYFYIPEIVGGHPSVVPGVTISYASTHSDDVAEFDIGEPMPHPETGEPGVWYPE